MIRSTLVLAAAVLLASPALAQVHATHVEANGAVSGRSPHKVLRPIAAMPACGATMHIPAGKLATYGTTALDPRCRGTQMASSEKAAGTARD